MSRPSTVPGMKTAPICKVDAEMFARFCAAGVGDRLLADTLIEAAAAVTVFRHLHRGEPLGERGRDFANALARTQLLYARTVGRA
jgi:hypothetical protein